MEPTRIPTHGAVDLSALKAARPAASAASSAPAGAGGGGYVVEVAEATFQEQVLDRSMTVPVVIDFWAEWCGPCKQLSPLLERLATEYAGRWLLAKVDVDANQRLTAAIGVQSIPTIIGVVRGQPVPLFTGAIPEPQVRQFLDELLRVAAANGVTGTVEAVPEPAGAEADGATEAGAGMRGAGAAHPDAEAAIQRGDLDGAAAAYRAALDQRPADPEAAQGLARVELLRRTRGLDQAAVRTRAMENPDDASAQIEAADLDVLEGRVAEAFDRLIDAIRRTSGDDRDRLRTHVLQLFDVVGPEDPQVRTARSSLASALF